MENIEQFIKQNRVFILGAGFSAAAGIPMIGKLLSKSMRLFHEECPGLYERVNNYTKTCFSISDIVDYAKIDFAKLCTFLDFIELREYGGGERWSNNGSREKLTFRYYLAKEIMRSTPHIDEIPDLYIQFVNQLRQKDIVLSFNWDPLLELAITRLGKKYSYGFNENADICIYKLHGSVNWRLNVNDNMRLKWKPYGFNQKMMKDELYYCNELLYMNKWEETQPLMGDAEPYLVLPGSGKAYEVRPLAPLWYKPENIFAITHHVYIIGLSLSDDDFFIKSFFLNSLPGDDSYTGIPGRKITIINPDKEIVDNYSFIKDQKNVRFIFEKFSHSHIQQIIEDNQGAPHEHT